MEERTALPFFVNGIPFEGGLKTGSAKDSHENDGQSDACGG
jgi:hypothetical protein